MAPFLYSSTAIIETYANVDVCNDARVQGCGSLKTGRSSGGLFLKEYVMRFRESCIGLLFGLLAFAATSTQAATMRCGSNLISEGELIVDVIRKCGQPAQRQVVGPAVDANGYVAKGAATIENWVYGPSNGAYQYLRFVDGRLVEIRTRMN